MRMFFVSSSITYLRKLLSTGLRLWPPAFASSFKPRSSAFPAVRESSPLCGHSSAFWSPGGHVSASLTRAILRVRRWYYAKLRRTISAGRRSGSWVRGRSGRPGNSLLSTCLPHDENHQAIPVSQGWGGDVLGTLRLSGCSSC